jgi:hypothetical protein
VNKCNLDWAVWWYVGDPAQNAAALGRHAQDQYDAGARWQNELSASERDFVWDAWERRHSYRDRKIG